MHQLSANIKNRIEAIDTLRGFALLAITLRHFISRYNYPLNKKESNAVVQKIDWLIETADYHLLSGKVYPVFALLFGYTIYLISEKQRDNFKPFIVSRLLWLILFAGIDALLFPSGDILGLYIIVGLITVPFIKKEPKTLLLVAVFFLLQPFEWGRLLISYLGNGSDILHKASLSLKSDLDYAAINRSLLDNIWLNVTKGQASSLLWALETGRFSQTLSIMLIGIYLGKKGTLVNALTIGKKYIKWALVPAALVFVAFAIRKKYSGVGFSDEMTRQILSNWINIGVACIYMILFISLYKGLFERTASLLKYYGRMSLSNYILQSVLGGIIFAPYLLNIGTGVTTTGVVGMFIIVVLFQIMFSRAWLNEKRYGPVEFYWRKLSVL